MPLWHPEQDDAPQGFQWLIGDDAINSVYAWLRWSKDGKPVLVVANFTPVPRAAYSVGVRSALKALPAAESIRQAAADSTTATPVAHGAAHLG